jgi:hypothetical protein
MRTYGTYGHSGKIATDNLGNIFVSGTTGTNESDLKSTIVKYFPSGDTIWTRIYNGINHREVSPTDMKIDPKYNIYICGLGTADTGNTNYDLALLKYDSSGQLLWERTYDNYVYEFARTIAFDSVGNIIVAGFTDTLGLYVKSYIILKYTPEGALLWERIFSDYPFDLNQKLLATDKNCNIIVTGEYDVQPPYSANINTVKYDKNGNFLWSREYSQSYYTVGPISMALDTIGNIFITSPEVLFKYSPEGEYTRIDSNLNHYSQCDYKLCIDNNQNLYTTHVIVDTMGINIHKISTSKYNSVTGAKVWSTNYYGLYNVFFNLYNFYLDNADNIYILGNSFVNSGSGDTNFLVKYSQLTGIVQTGNIIPDKYKLYQNYPNPFNSMTNVKVQMLKQGYAELKIFDLTGRLIKVLLKKYLNIGEHSYKFNASEFASGVYFYRMQVGDFVQIKRMVLIK